MPSEKFNPNYPSPEELKKAEAHLTTHQKEYWDRGPFIEKIKKLGEQCGLSEDEIEVAITTCEAVEHPEKHETYTCILKGKKAEFWNMGTASGHFISWGDQHTGWGTKETNPLLKEQEKYSRFLYELYEWELNENAARRYAERGIMGLNQ